MQVEGGESKQSVESVESVESVGAKAIRLKREMVEVKCDQEALKQCSICLEEVKSFAYHTRCGHTFHSRCITRYRTVSGSSQMSVRGYNTHDPLTVPLSSSPSSRRLQTVIDLAQRVFEDRDSVQGTEIPCPNCRTMLSQPPSTSPSRCATSRDLRRGDNVHFNYGHRRRVVVRQVPPPLEVIDLDFY